jgi:hypothetical protein
MTDRFTDSAGVSLSFVSVEVDEGATTPVFVAKVPCRAGRVLTADPDSGLTVTARRTGTGAAFADIASAPVDLTPFDGLTVSFDFKVTAGAVSANSPLQAVVKIAYA